MATATAKPKSKGAAARTEKHREGHRLIQTWVSPMLYEAISTRAKNEGRPLANHVRRELGKLHGVDE